MGLLTLETLRMVKQRHGEIAIALTETYEKMQSTRSKLLYRVYVVQFDSLLVEQASLELYLKEAKAIFGKL